MRERTARGAFVRVQVAFLIMRGAFADQADRYHVEKGTDGELYLAVGETVVEKSKFDLTGLIAAGIMLKTLKAWFAPILKIFTPQTSILSLFGKSFFPLFKWF